MLLKYFYDKELAQASYMVGCAATGEALVIDANRDIQQYLDAAEAEGLRITHVTETHIHADYVSGSRELAAATGARLYLSDEGDADWKYGFVGENTVLLHDGDMWMVGNIRVDVLHTPGHTPEHISFMITDTAGADRPIGVFTGDWLFVGDIGRPDLLDEAAGFEDTRFGGARLQYQNVLKFREMADYLQIWPAHGAGSACGKALGAIPSTTLGYEKLFNPAFQFDNEDDFVNWLLADQPEAPRYFAQMKKVNKLGPALLADLPPVETLGADDLATLPTDALIIDTRDVEAYSAAHLPQTINVPASSGGFNTYVGWYVDFDAPTYLILEDDQRDAVLTRLRAIGVDLIPGTFSPDVIGDVTTTLPSMSADALQERMAQNGLKIIDVRGRGEYAAGHIAGAWNIPMGYLPRYLNELPRDEALVLHCQGGTRSAIAASVLQRNGFNNVINLEGGLDAWNAAGLPVEFAPEAELEAE